MFSTSPVMSTIPCTDLVRARDFYERILGLHPQPVEAGGGVMLEAGDGTAIYLYITKASPGAATRVAFLSDEFDADVSRLRDSHILLEDYDLTSLREGIEDLTESVIKVEPGIFSDPTMGKTCWFKDPDGNIINLVENKVVAKRAAA